MCFQARTGREQQFKTAVANGKASAAVPQSGAESSDASSDDEDEDDEDKPLPGELEDSEGDDESLPELGDDMEASGEPDDEDEEQAADETDDASDGIGAAKDVAGSFDARGRRNQGMPATTQDSEGVTFAGMASVEEPPAVATGVPAIHNSCSNW